MYKNDKNYHTVLDSFPANVALLDKNGVIVAINHLWQKNAGKFQSLAALGDIGSNFFEISGTINIPSDKLNNEVQQGIRDILSGRKEEFHTRFGVEYSGSKADYFMLASSVNGDFAGAIILNIDISQHQALENFLRDRELKLTEIISCSKDILYRLNLETSRYDYLSPSLEKTLGYPLEEIRSISSEDTYSYYHPDDAPKLKSYFSQVLSSNEDPDTGFSVDYRIRHANGGYLWFSDRFSVIRDSEGVPRAIVGTVRDITEQKQTEKILNNSREMITKFRDSATDGFLLFDNNLKLMDINPKALSYISAQKEDLLGTHIAELTPEPPPDSRLETYRNVLRTGRPVSLEVRHYNTLNGDLYLALRVFKVGEGLGVIVTDITEKHNSEQAVKDSEKRFRELADLLPGCVYEMDLEGNLLFANQSAFEMFGYTREDFDKGLRAFDLFIPEDTPNIKANAQTILSGIDSRGNEYTAVRKDGSTFKVISYSNRILKNDNPVGIRGIILDVTNVKLTAEKLAESEKRFRGTFEFSSVGMAIVDLDGRFVQVNPHFCEMLGYSEDELTGKHFLNITDEGDVEPGLTIFKQLTGGEIKNARFEKRYKDKNGDFIWTVVTSSVVYDPGGKPKYLTSQYHDITDRRNAEKALEESEFKHRTLFETMSPGAMYLDPQGHLLSANPAAFEILGRSFEEIESLSNESEEWNTIREDGAKFPPEEHPIAITLKTGEPIKGVTMGIFNPQKNKHVWIVVDCIPHYRSGENKPFMIYATFTDITELKETENELTTSRNRYEMATVAAKVGVWDWNLQTGEFYLDPNIKSRLGYQDHELPNDIEIWSGYIHPDDKEEVMQAAQDHIDGLTDSYTIVHRMIHKDGSVRWFETRGKRVLNNEGIPVRLIGTDEDITLRKKEEFARLRSEEKFAKAFKSSPDAVLLLTYPEYLIIEASDSFYENTGFIENEVINNSLDDLNLWVHENYYEKFQKRIQENRKVNNLYTEFRAKNGEILDIQISAETIEIDNHIHLLVVIRNITELNEAIEALRISEARYKAVSELTSHFAYAFDIDEQGNFTNRWITEGFAEITGYYLEELSQMDDWKPATVHPNDIGLIAYGIEQLMSGEANTTDLRIRRKDGELRWLRVYGKPIIGKRSRQVMRIYGAAQDITEKKLADVALRESEERFKAQFMSIPMPTYTWKRVDDDFVLEQWNDAAEDTTQGIINNLKGIRAGDLYSDQPEIISNIELCFTSRGTFSEERHYHTRTTDEIKYLKVSYAFAPPDLVIIHVMDLTERKSAEEALKRSEEKYRILVENVRAAIGIMDSDGRLLFANRVGAEIMGMEINELVGKTQWEMFPEALAEQQIKSVKGVIETGKELQTEIKTFVRGGWRWFDLHIQPFLLSDFGKEAAMIIASDITDRKISDNRDKARMNLLNELRDCETIDECLNSACEAIYEAGLFKRSVLTLHDTRKRICNLGYKGLDPKIVNAARKAPPPSDEQTAWMTQEKFRIRNSFFIPEEAGMKGVPRYIPADEFNSTVKSPWKPKDELFVPIREDKDRIEGWLSVDTPFNHNRPTEDVIINLEEIVDIVGKKVHEIQSMQQLERERLALEEKNIALKEVLGHIEEEKVHIRQQIASNIDRILMPTLNKLIGNDTRINPSYLQILKNGLEELSNSTGGILHQYSKLSPREIEVCNLIKNGSTSKEIAGTLNITIETVNKHRRTIRKKLGISKKDINLVTFLNRI